MLSKQDMDIVSGTIFTSSWYPFETYMNCFNAVIRVVTRGNKQMLYDWGFAFAEEIVLKSYRNLIVANSPLETIMKQTILMDIIFDFGTVSIEPLADREALVRIAGFPPRFEAFYLLIRGWFSKILLLGGAQSIQSEFISQSWKGDAETVIKYTW